MHRDSLEVDPDEHTAQRVDRGRSTDDRHGRGGAESAAASAESAADVEPEAARAWIGRAGDARRCLVHEAEIQGRIPKIAEGAGVTGDYVLTRAKVIKGTPPASPTAMYDVDDIDAGQLESYVNQRVQIDGWFDELDRATSPAGRGGASDDLVEIRGSAIRAVAKDCGAAN